MTAQAPRLERCGACVGMHTERLTLRPFGRHDRDWFVALHADAEVMHDYGGPLQPEESEAKLERYRTSASVLAHGRLAVETRAGEPVGYTGVMAGPDDHPLGAHLQIGWRLCRPMWGRGFAVEAAAAVLGLHFARFPSRDVFAYTAADNVRSQGVMARLKLRRAEARDFVSGYPGLDAWRGLVWIADPASAPTWT